MEKLDKDFLKQLVDEAANRFINVSAELLIDRVTGIEYLRSQGFGGGLVPVLDADGKPRINEHFRK